MPDETTTDVKESPKEVKPEANDAGEKSLFEELGESIREFTKKYIEEAKKPQDTASGKVGELTLVDDGKGTAKPEPKKIDVQDAQIGKDDGFGIDIAAGPLEQMTPADRAELTRKFETDARLTLDGHLIELIKANKMKFTTDGSEIVPVEYKEGEVTTAEETLEHMAARLLGPKATKEQIGLYRDALWTENSTQVQTGADHKPFLPAGSTIKLPAYSKDGSVVTAQEYQRRDGSTAYKIVKSWSDGSRIETNQDGHGEVHFRDKDKKEVTIAWDQKDPTANYETRTKWVETNRATGDGYDSGMRRTVDEYGRERVEELGPDGPKKITITDKESNITELTRDAHGDYKGKKTNHGKVVEDDVQMTDKGVIYSTKEDKATGEKTLTFENGRVNTYAADGNLKSVEYSDDKKRTIREEYSGGKESADAVIVKGKDDTVTEFRPNATGELVGTKKDASGKVLESDLHVSFREPGKLRFYTETTDAGGSTRKFEDGVTHRLDNAGKLVKQEGTDDFGRKYSAEFTPGERIPTKLTLTPRGGVPVEFNRDANGSLVAEVRSGSGRVEGTVEFQLNNGSLHYADASGNEIKVDYPNGTSVTTQFEADGSKVVTERQEANTHTFTLDADGRKVKETFVTPPTTTQIDTQYEGKDKKAEKVIISGPGEVTTLQYDKDTKSYTGDRVRVNGGTESAALIGNKLVFRDKTTGQVTEAIERRFEDGKIAPTLQKVDYDPNTGTLSTDIAGVMTFKRSFSPGRYDMEIAGGYMIGHSNRGDFSTVSPSGETTLIHGPEGTGAHLKPDGTIQFWDKEGKTTTENLSDVEKDYMAKHANADKRDLAEIHRRLSPDQKKIDGFIKALDKIDTAANLNASERQDLRDSLLRHVAYPAEIYQGKSPTCNVSVVQREMAMNDPERYVTFTTEAISTGKYTTPSGQEVHFDRDNLKLLDSSGRDIGSRIFQAAAVQTVLYPDKVFRNTESGVGEILTKKSESVAADGSPVIEYNNDAQSFEGLKVFQVVKASNELTGEVKGAIKIKSTEDLVAVFKANDGRPLTLAVDAKEYPFKEVGPVGSGVGLNHVVTITGIDQGPPVKIYVQNQWGLTADHSIPSTAISADDLIRNITHGGATEGLAIGKVKKNDPNQVYDIKSKAGSKVDLKPACRIQQDSTGKWACK